MFKTDLNKSQIPLFIWARPTFSFPGRPTRAPCRPQPPRCPRPLTGWSRLSAPRSSLPLPDGPRSSATPPLGTVAAAHLSTSLPPPLFDWQSTHGAHRPHPQVSGRCRPGAARRSAGTHLLVPRFLHTSARFPNPHRPLPHPPPLKREPDDATMPQSAVSSLEFRPQHRRRSPAR
jgi:hypothetical protein